MLISCSYSHSVAENKNPRRSWSCESITDFTRFCSSKSIHFLAQVTELLFSNVWQTSRERRWRDNNIVALVTCVYHTDTIISELSPGSTWILRLWIPGENDGSGGSEIDSSDCCVEERLLFNVVWVPHNDCQPYVSQRLSKQIVKEHL